MKFKCFACDEIFDEPYYGKDAVGYYGSAPYYETVAYCPECGSADFDEALECDICSGFHFQDDLLNGTCERCSEDAVNSYTTELGKLFLRWLYKDPFQGEREFYLEAAGLPHQGNIELVDLLKENPQILPDFEKQLKEWCLSDIAYWSEFYYDNDKPEQPIMQEESNCLYNKTA